MPFLNNFSILQPITNLLPIPKYLGSSPRQHKSSTQTPTPNLHPPAFQALLIFTLSAVYHALANIILYNKANLRGELRFLLTNFAIYATPRRYSRKQSVILSYQLGRGIPTSHGHGRKR